jgi:hypothetical protein
MTAALLVDPIDTVAVCLADVAADGRVKLSDGREIIATMAVPRGHKIAIRKHAAGGSIIKYGASIGEAAVPIAVGEHVHTHNVASDRARRLAV